MFSIEEIHHIECEMREEQRTAYDDALELLAEHGIEVGVWVETLDYRDGTPTGKVYEVTSIGGHRKDSLWLYGKKLRRDDTFGAHIHTISSPDCVRVVDGSVSESREKADG